MNKPLIVTMMGLVIFSSLNIIFNNDGDLILVSSVGVSIAGILMAVWIWNVSRKDNVMNNFYSSLFRPTPTPAKRWPVVSAIKSIAISSKSSAIVFLMTMFVLKDQLMGCDDCQ